MDKDINRIKVVLAEKKRTLVGNDPYGDKYVLVHPLWSDEYIDTIVRNIGIGYKPLSAFGITKLSNE